jgi:hypothetical protein
MAASLKQPRRSSMRIGVAHPSAGLLIEVDHRLARHAVEDLPPDDALLLAIETVLEAAIEMRSERPVTAIELAQLDEEFLEPLIRRGQSQGLWSAVAPAAQLALSLRSLIAGLLPVSTHCRQEPWTLARRIHVLFGEAAANAGSP